MRWLGRAVLLVSIAVSGGYAETPTTWTGFVTDMHCGTHCQRISGMRPDPKCVRDCVHKGSKYGLWYMHHVYELEPQSRAKRFAAENVRVHGWMENDVLHIDSIALTPPPRSGAR